MGMVGIGGGEVKIDFTPWLCRWPIGRGQAQGFPDRFWGYWRKTYAKDPMLHLFCGSSMDGEMSIDIQGRGANVKMDVFQADIPKNYFASAFADPPYTEEFAKEWGCEYPRPSSILKIMCDSVIPGGVVGILHLQVLRPTPGLEKVAWHPVFCGTTKHIRCLSVFKKKECLMLPLEVVK